MSKVQPERRGRVHPEYCPQDKYAEAVNSATARLRELSPNINVRALRKAPKVWKLKIGKTVHKEHFDALAAIKDYIERNNIGTREGDKAQSS